MNFALFLEMHARGTPDALALVDPRLRFTFAELDRAVNQCANMIKDSGLGRGDRLAVYLPNRAEAAIALLAGMKAGVTVVPLNWRLAGPDLARIVDHCAPACLLTTEQKANELDKTGAAVLAVGDTASTGSFWAAVKSRSTQFRSTGCQNADVANLLYTSGTTSVPKAAIHTHGMRVAIAAAMADCFHLSRRDVGLAISPLFHTSGMSVFSNCIFVGCPLVLLEKWDVGEFVRTIAAEKVTFMHLIGTIVVDIARAPEALFDRGPSSVRLTWGGGHSLDPQALKTFERRIGGVFLQGYSRTEGGLTYNPIEPERRRFDSNGFANRNSADVAIMDPATQRFCPDGVTGEIVVRGDGVSPGYWDHDFVRSRPTYEGGWQPTGDVGCVDPAAGLRFLGRSDHMIKTGGENVYPNEVEAVLLAMPQVADAVVVGIPDERLGHRVAALVVRADASVTTTEIDQACRAALAGFKIPRTLAFTDSLPRLGTQKVDLAACRRILAGAAQ